jgi:hypothetical protein
MEVKELKELKDDSSAVGFSVKAKLFTGMSIIISTFQFVNFQARARMREKYLHQLHQLHQERGMLKNVYLCISACSEKAEAVHRKKQAPHEKI